MVNQIVHRNKEQDKKEEEECNPIPNNYNPSKINSYKNHKWGVTIHRIRMIINRKMTDTRKINHHNNNLNP